MTPTPNNCCEECRKSEPIQLTFDKTNGLGASGAVLTVCSNPVCSCHTNPAASAPKCEHGMLLINCSAYHSDQPQQDWGKTFGELFVVQNKSSTTGEWWRVPTNGVPDVASPTEVRDFISSTIAAEQKKLLQELLEEVENSPTITVLDREQVAALLQSRLDAMVY